jgi:hypothetical protein
MVLKRGRTKMKEKINIFVSGREDCFNNYEKDSLV